MGNGRLVMFSDGVYTIFTCWLQIRAAANFFANSYNIVAGTLHPNCVHAKLTWRAPWRMGQYRTLCRGVRVGAPCTLATAHHSSVTIPRCYSYYLTHMSSRTTLRRVCHRL